MSSAISPVRRNSPAIPLWYQSQAKRGFDLICATALLILFLPLMALAAVLVKLSSPGPIFFRQRRVGRDWNEITILKFRTMHFVPQPNGPGLTQRGDSRVTRLGRLLRESKLDELPQLLNVICGDMTMVGPRPDLAEYLAELPPRFRELTTLRPGLTGWASLRYRNEERMLAAIPADKLKELYVRDFLPRKARLDLAYGKRSTLWSDIALLFRTALAILQ